MLTLWLLLLRAAKIYVVEQESVQGMSVVCLVLYWTLGSLLGNRLAYDGTHFLHRKSLLELHGLVADAQPPGWIR